MLGVTLQQRAHGLPVAVIDGVKQCLALVGFGIALGCLPGMRNRNIEMIFAHFLFLLLHGLAGILPQTKC